MLDPQRLRSELDAVASRLATRSFVLDVQAFRMLEESVPVLDRAAVFMAARRPNH